MNTIYYRQSDSFAPITIYASNQNRSLLDRLLIEQAQQRLGRVIDMAEKALEKCPVLSVRNGATPLSP